LTSVVVVAVVAEVVVEIISTLVAVVVVAEVVVEVISGDLLLGVCLVDN
jgi:hypothetical protein